MDVSVLQTTSGFNQSSRKARLDNSRGTGNARMKPATLQERSQSGIRWRKYEAMKQAWIAAHRNATPEQYQRAVAQIAKRCGV
jgi:choline dehydrogenase-like flavoprotein